MRLWEYVIRADDELDLADPASGETWFRRQKWVPTADSPGACAIPQLRPWTHGERAEWRRCVFALRSVVRRVTATRPRRPVPAGALAPRATIGRPNDHADREADSIWNSYLGKLAQQVSSGRRDRHGLRAPIGRGVLVALCPTRHDPRTGVRRLLAVDEYWYELDVFLQRVFASIDPPAEPSGPFEPVCTGCGKRFPAATKNGRRSWRNVCADCAAKRWKEKNKDQMREIWASAKRKQRKKDKARRQTRER